MDNAPSNGRHFIYFYFNRNEPEKIRQVVPAHVQYWKTANLKEYRGGPFVDRIRGEVDSGQFIRSLAGTNRYILDYLLEEVLNNQTPEIQHFLMETSILARLCPPLCDALLKSCHHGMGV